SYMAPEQATADPHTDHRADIYAVGALAYEMLAGRPPFIGPTPQAVLAAQVTQAPEPVTRTRAAVPPALAALIMRCLEKRPADRWQSADELLHQLEAMATPSGGMAPTGATAAVSLGEAAAPPVPVARPHRWHRAGYLVLGLLLALAAAWGVSRYRGDHASTGVSAGSQAIVVLPFENLGRPEDEYFADGITEEITNRLTGIGGLRVIARSSAKQYKDTRKSMRQIGDELGVAYVLEGTVRWERAGDTTSRVRVSPQLIRVADGTNVWAHGYDAVLSGVFQIQSDIAEQVASALDIALAGPERTALAAQPTRNTEAYQYYLRGNEFLNRGYAEEDFTKAAQMYREAVRLDSGFALAFTRLAWAHDGLYWFNHDRTEQRLALAKAAVDRALLLAPDLPEAHTALGWYLYHGRLDYAGALEQFAIARARQPNDSDLLGGIGAVQRRQGKWKDAIATLDRAADLDPQSPLGHLEAGVTHLLVRDFEEAAKRFDRTILLAPDQPEGYALRARVHLARDHSDSAQHVLRQAADRAGIEKLVRARLFFGLLFLISGDNALGGELERLPREAFGSDTAGFLQFRADLHRLRQQPVLARVYLDSLAVLLEQEARVQPDVWRLHQALGITYARRGQEADAIREARRAVELLPMSKDAFFGGNALADLAKVYALVGEPDSALPKLDTLLSVPSWVSAGLLRSDPDWSSLRGNARFQRLLAGAR
ncbi:MAG: tetratricopeptide repeat protein, partial [Gemmatimonadales bacterium]